MYIYKYIYIMKIHRTKMGCLNMVLRQRSVSNGTDKMAETPSQEANHTAGSIHAKESEADMAKIRERIKFPQQVNPPCGPA